MSRSFRWLLAAVVALGASNAMAQAASCNITYTWPTWVGGNGFGASIDIHNTGAAITNGWTLVFNFPNGQQLQNGWPVSITQSGATVTAASNADWNKAIPANGTFNVAFNATFSGANNPPGAFTLNGSACSIGNSTNTPPTVSVSSPTAGQNFASGTAVPLAANATDNGGVVRVEFRVDGNLVNTDTSAPYSFSATGLANGTHSVTATAVDNGNPALSTTSTAVSFSVGGGGNTPPTVSLTSPTAGQAFSAGAAVPLAATASDNSGVVRVEFRIDGNLVGTDTSSPYTFSATGVAAGSHTATATAVDNGNPALSTTSTAVSFTVGTSGTVWRVNPQGRITRNGTVFPVRCGNWFGLEGRHEPSNDATNPSGAPMEQYIGNTFWANGGAGTGRTIQQTMQEISGMGINMIRLPLVPQTLNANDPQGTGSVLKNHPSVRIANSRLALETMITAAAANNIAVLLDIHSCSNYVGWRKGRLDARPLGHEIGTRSEGAREQAVEVVLRHGAGHVAHRGRDEVVAAARVELQRLDQGDARELDVAVGGDDARAGRGRGGLLLVEIGDRAGAGLDQRLELRLLRLLRREVLLLHRELSLGRGEREVVRRDGVHRGLPRARQVAAVGGDVELRLPQLVHVAQPVEHGERRREPRAQRLRGGRADRARARAADAARAARAQGERGEEGVPRLAHAVRARGEGVLRLLDEDALPERDGDRVLEPDPGAGRGGLCSRRRGGGDQGDGEEHSAHSRC